jgi:two-component system LytT family response regulator
MSGESSVRVLIVDDEPLARERLRDMLKADSRIEIIGECVGGEQAIEAIQELAPDLVFLDVEMPGKDGFSVLEALDADHLPVVIFVTAYDQYAVRAFEVHALDYLLKPFDDARFEKALRQAKTQLEQREINQLSKRLVRLLEDRDTQPNKARAAGLISRLMIKSASRVFFLKVDEIDWIEAADYYVKLHVGRKSHLLRETMSDMEAKLDPEQFVRIHRSAIVNLDRVKEMHAHFNGEYLVILQDGTELKLSRSRREQLQQMLNPGSS